MGGPQHSGGLWFCVPTRCVVRLICFLEAPPRPGRGGRSSPSSALTHVGLPRPRASGRGCDARELTVSPRERSKAAMAALNRRNPILDDFVGLNWSCWADRVSVFPSDAGSSDEDSSMCGGNQSETMTLRKEDMHIYGHCPAHDDFYLVVCSHCGQVVKPGAFEKHCVRRHGSLTKMCGQSSTLAPQQRPRPGQPSPNLSSSRERPKGGMHHEDRAPSSAAIPVHQDRLSKAQREAVSLPPVEKFPQENPLHPHHSPSMPRQRVPPLHSGPLPPGNCPASTPMSERHTMQKSTAGQFNESRTPLQGPRTYSRINKNIDKKECDMNKHCRALDPERKKMSSQELTCNTDSIHQQQKAVRRIKTFDQVAAGRDMEQLLVKLKDKEQHGTAMEEKITTQANRYNFNSNCHILRTRDPKETFLEEEGDSTVEVEIQPPYPFNQSLLSSEESEDDEQEEAADLPASTSHPKPLGLCTFGCRTLGCSIFTFDRRFHHLQFALSAMLEHHVSTHLWKKMPQVSSGLRSCHATIPPTVRTVARAPQSTSSTSLGQPETKSSQHNSQSTKAPSSTSSGQWSNTVRQSGKAQLKARALMQDVSAALKATRLPHNSEDKSSRHVMHPLLRETGKPHMSPSQGPATVTFSQGKKPCHPLPRQPSEKRVSGSAAPTHCSPCSRVRPPAIQQMVVGLGHKGHGQKRKGSDKSPLLSASVSRTSKCKRLSSPSRSNLLAWKGDGIGACLGKRSNS
ncbi:ataxin-7-like protein 2b [Echeneis naucrates]|uniref:Ataxin-7-like protein 2 n=1 Tax=Echeneis naucrates TaxID=173247 RepID=A0A665UWK4_ECHNA|nr:ataxin-7-like protein 2 [Echeneis naucrates]